MNELLQTVGSGILMGCFYGILGLGIVIIFKASEAFNFAIGEILVVGSFLFYIFYFDLRLPFILAFPLGLLAAGAIGAAIEHLSIKPLLGRAALSMTIITLGLASVLRATLQFVFGAHSYSFFMELPDLSLEFDDLLFPSERIWAALLCIGAFVAILFFLFRTRWGVAIRAASENQAKAMAFGIDAPFLLLLVWALSSMCIAVAGVMISNFGALSYLTGIVGLRAIPVVLIGGMDSVGGALVGGLIVGLCEALVGSYIEPLGLVGFKDVAPYILLLIVLFIRPYGLWGTVRIERI